MINYREYEALNQSRLKLLLNHPNAYKQNFNKSSNSLSLGSVIDTLILSKKEVFYELFEVKDYEEPKDKLKDALDYLINSKVKFTDKNIINACNKADYRASQSDDVKLKYVKPYEDYYKANLQLDDSKRIITTEMLSIANQCVFQYRNNEVIQDFLRNKEIVTHKVFIWKMYGYECKGELDILLIDHNNKTVTEVDIKTSSSDIYSFSKDFKRYRYDFQRAFYNVPVTLYSNSIGYKVTNPYIIYIPTNTSNPILFKVPNKCFSGKDWRDRYGNKIESVKTAFKKLQWHEENDLWEYPMDYYLNKYMELDL